MLTVTDVIGEPPAPCPTACPVENASTTGTASSMSSKVSPRRTDREGMRKCNMKVCKVV